MSKALPALPKSRALFVLLTAFAGFCQSATCARATTSCPAGSLGVTRTLSVGTKGGFAIGFKSYPQSLELADHEVVLTFDDGPSPATTPRVLDALEQQCVHATFFLIGRNAAAYPALVKREIAAGETVGHHSFSHPARTLRLLTTEAAKADIENGLRADDVAAYGKSDGAPKTGFFRFPGFADSPALNAWLASRNVGIFGADLWASDWLPMTPDQELRLVMERLEKDGRGILLLHDTKRATALMLPKLLAALKERGFHIVHLVPAEGAPPKLHQAPKGWISETEEILAKVLHVAHAGRAEMPRKVRYEGRHRSPPNLPEP